jgi:hypothetical protein
MVLMLLAKPTSVSLKVSDTHCTAQHSMHSTSQHSIAHNTQHGTARHSVRVIRSRFDQTSGLSLRRRGASKSLPGHHITVWVADTIHARLAEAQISFKSLREEGGVVLVLHTPQAD